MSHKTVFLVNLPLSSEGLRCHEELLNYLQNPNTTFEHPALQKLKHASGHALQDVTIFFMAESALLAHSKLLTEDVSDNESCHYFNQLQDLASRYIKIKDEYHLQNRTFELLVCGMAAKTLDVRDHLREGFALSGYMDLIKLANDAANACHKEGLVNSAYEGVLSSTNLSFVQFVLNNEQASTLGAYTRDSKDCNSALINNTYDMVVVFNRDTACYRTSGVSAKALSDKLGLNDINLLCSEISLEQGLGIALNACDLDLEVAVVFNNSLLDVSDTLIKKLKQLRLYGIASYVIADKRSDVFATSLGFVEALSKAEAATLLSHSRITLVS